MSDCIFCKIINGTIPCYKVYEDNNILAFLDITQVTKGHTLIIPKQHVSNVFEWTNTISQTIGQALPIIANALQKSFPNMKGLNIVNNNGEIAYQSVFHSHIHLIPRYSTDDALAISFGTQKNPYSTEEMEQIAKYIENNI